MQGGTAIVIATQSAIDTINAKLQYPLTAVIENNLNRHFPGTAGQDTFASENKTTNMIASISTWLLCIINTALIIGLVAISRNDRDKDDLDPDTGKPLPVLTHKEDYYDPTTGVHVETYEEDYEQ